MSPILAFHSARVQLSWLSLILLIPNKKTILRLIVTFLLMLAFSRTTLAEDVPQKEDPAWIDETMEEMVIPLKQWLEYDNKPSSEPSALPNKTMRQAIKEATSLYPGMVLSVKKSDIFYQVKILSKQGVVKLIDISMALPKATP